jgi:hypothetical protein
MLQDQNCADQGKQYRPPANRHLPAHQQMQQHNQPYPITYVMLELSTRNFTSQVGINPLSCHGHSGRI